LKPDIVQTHAVKSHFLIRLAGINRKRPWIAFHHGYTWTSMRTRVYNELDRWSLRAPDRVVTVCSPFASILQGIGVRPERILIQHNAVKPFSPASVESTRQLRCSLGIDENTAVVLCAGRLSREKAQTDLIEAAWCIRKKDAKRNIRFLIAGDGPDRELLKDLAKNRMVTDWVVFTGQIADLTPYYTIADIAVLPSHSEGSPNVLLEAMAAGLPIVATRVGGVPDIVQHQNQALLVEKQDSVSLANAIEQLLDDAALRTRLSAAALKSISAYTPDAYRDSILALYQSCLATKSPSPKSL